MIMLAIAFGFGLTFSLWQVDQNNQAGRTCMGLMTASTSILALAFVIQYESEQWRLISYTFISVQMLHGPLLYFYTRLQTQAEFRWQNRYILHGLPALVLALLWLWQIPLRDDDPFFVSCASAECSKLQGHRFWHKVAAWISLLTYSLASLYLLKPHENNMKARYSSLEGVQLRWLKSMAWCVVILTTVGVLADISRELGLIHSLRGGHLQALGPFVIIVLIAKYGLKQTDIYQSSQREQGTIKSSPQPPLPTNEKQVSITQPDNTSPEHTPTAKKYQTSSLTRQDAMQLWKKVQHLMETQQPYLEAGLKITDLANLLAVPVNHLSETINGYAELSFYDYINGLRVRAATELMSDAKMAHLSVTDIGFHSGFNSNSTFFTHFKKYTGHTPKQYRTQLTSLT